MLLISGARTFWCFRLTWFLCCPRLHRTQRVRSLQQCIPVSTHAGYAYMSINLAMSNEPSRVSWCLWHHAASGCWRPLGGGLWPHAAFGCWRPLGGGLWPRAASGCQPSEVNNCGAFGTFEPLGFVQPLAASALLAPRGPLRLIILVPLAPSNPLGSCSLWLPAPVGHPEGL